MLSLTVGVAHAEVLNDGVVAADCEPRCHLLVVRLVSVVGGSAEAALRPPVQPPVVSEKHMHDEAQGLRRRREHEHATVNAKVVGAATLYVREIPRARKLGSGVGSVLPADALGDVGDVPLPEPLHHCGGKHTILAVTVLFVSTLECVCLHVDVQPNQQRGRRRGSPINIHGRVLPLLKCPGSFPGLLLWPSRGCKSGRVVSASLEPPPSGARWLRAVADDVLQHVSDGR
mmetsp:Transcript_35950/g.112873  ORF Transcript_35950/g.112873 Transcript_35950/m.112873 type:complete len:230 (+) Transcript_35950:486-1175(+)